MGQPTIYNPQTMTTEDWLAILCILWTDFKNSLTVMQEFEFNQNMVVSKVVECKPLEHKPKTAPPSDIKAGKVEAKVGRDRKAQAKPLASPAPAKKVKFDANKKKAPA